MIVPDSRPDLQHILRCEGKVKIRETRVTDDRVSFAGEVEVAVLYRAKNGERPVYAMEYALPVEDFLYMEGLTREMEAEVQARLEHLDCQVINDRKIGVKAVLLAEAEAEQKRKAKVLTDVAGTGVETLTKPLQTEQEVGAVKDRFTVKEEVTIPASQPEIGEILTETIRLTEQDIRPMEGRAQVRGNLCISLLYTDSEGNLGSVAEKIPFSGYLENSGFHPKTDVTGKLTVEECRLTPAVDEDGETRQMGVDVTIGVELKGTEWAEQQVLQDAYAPEGELSLQKENITFPVTAARGRNQFTVKERFHLENGEMPMLKAEMVWCDARLSDVRTVQDGVEAEGVLMAEVLYHCADDQMPVAVLRRGIPFSQMMELKGVSAEDTADLSLQLEDVEFQMLSDREGELRAAVSMEAAVRRQEQAEVVTDAVWEEATLPQTAGAVVYVVQKGDTLWHIAKKYRTTVTDILAVNEVDDPAVIYPGQKLLILRRAKGKV
ncbi:MAG: DUF3794 domain-containing protein, partial [Anaerotignum sp.]|nr:DUF3794 domain-containing protein [Anaerotignum sp.]